jgi:hypothetical protein
MSHRVDRGVPAMECGLGGRMPVPVSGSVFGHRDFAILNADSLASIPLWQRLPGGRCLSLAPYVTLTGPKNG